MKKLPIFGAGVLLFSCLSVPLYAHIKPLDQPREPLIRTRMSDLQKAEVQIQSDEQNIQDTRQKLDTWILSPTDRASMMSILGMDQGKINAFKADVHGDWLSLRRDWKELTPDQRDVVTDAPYFLDQWGLN